MTRQSVSFLYSHEGTADPPLLPLCLCHLLPWLLQGVLLKSSGQKGDAERMFIQAKYLAPKEAMSVVMRVIEQSK